MLRNALFKPEEKSAEKTPAGFNHEALALYKAIIESNLFKPLEKNGSLFLALSNLNGHADFYCESSFENEKLKEKYKPEHKLSMRYNLILSKDALIEYSLERIIFDPHYHSSSSDISPEEIEDPQVKKFHEEVIAPLLAKKPANTP